MIDSPFLPKIENPDIRARCEFLGFILPKLEAIALKYFRTTSMNVENKDTNGSFDPVTIADREIEQKFRALLATNFPQDDVLGEEFESQTTNSAYRWVIDPIDGTRAFVVGSTSFTILIALEIDGKPSFGVISQPFTGEQFWGVDTQAYWSRAAEHKLITTSPCKLIENAKLSSTFPEVGSLIERQAFEKVRDRVRLTRYGMDGYAYALLAAGHIDIIVEACLKPFDYAAPRAVILGAGGVFCGWDGGEIKDGRVLAAATPELAQIAIELLQAN